MAEAKNLVREPNLDSAVKLLEFSGEKMIGAFHDNQVIIARQRRHQRFDFSHRSELVIASMHEKLRFVALA